MNRQGQVEGDEKGAKHWTNIISVRESRQCEAFAQSAEAERWLVARYVSHFHHDHSVGNDIHYVVAVKLKN